MEGRRKGKWKRGRKGWYREPGMRRKVWPSQYLPLKFQNVLFYFLFLIKWSIYKPEASSSIRENVLWKVHCFFGECPKTVDLIKMNGQFLILLYSYYPPKNRKSHQKKKKKKEEARKYVSNVSSRSIHSSPKLETTQTFIRNRMDR